LLVGGLWRVDRHRAFFPIVHASAPAMQLHAEMAEIERRIQRSVSPVSQHHVHGLTDEVGLTERPAAFAVGLQHKQSLASCNKQPVAHV
jgi:hypothetical protein